MLDRAAQSPGISGLIERGLSIEDVSVYKPSPVVYRHAVERLQVDPGNVAFFSSDAWGATGASEFGFVTHWVNRSGQPKEYALRSKVIEFGSLFEFSINHSTSRRGI
jgi:2-haloacid dehalogenase